MTAKTYQLLAAYALAFVVGAAVTQQSVIAAAGVAVAIICLIWSHRG